MAEDKGKCHIHLTQALLGHYFWRDGCIRSVSLRTIFLLSFLFYTLNYISMVWNEMEWNGRIGEWKSDGGLYEYMYVSR